MTKKKPDSAIGILSYNIHKGFSTGNRRFVLKSLRDEIRSLGADIVFLQEVIGEHSEHARTVTDWPDVSQFEYLADTIWTHHAYGKNALFDGGHHGNAILSKYPIVEWENYNVSTNRFEQRGILHAVLDVPGYSQYLHCICVHFGLTGRGRKIQVAKLCDRIRRSVKQGCPLIIAGDFNDWGVTASRALQRSLDIKEVFKYSRGRHAATFPAALPLLQLDRIYVRGLAIEEARPLRGRPWSKLSDHTPLFALVSAEK